MDTQTSDSINPTREIVSFWQGFKEFLSRYSVLGLAVAFVAGQAVNDLVQAIVKGVITPAVQVFIPGEDLRGLTFMFHGITFDFGMVLDALLRFFIILFLIYFLVKLILRDETLLPPANK